MKKIVKKPGSPQFSKGQQFSLSYSIYKMPVHVPTSQTYDLFFYFASWCCDKHDGQKSALDKRGLIHHIYFWFNSERSHDRNESRDHQGRMLFYRLPVMLLLSQLSYTTQDQLPRGGTTQGGAKVHPRRLSIETASHRST